MTENSGQSVEDQRLSDDEFKLLVERIEPLLVEKAELFWRLDSGHSDFEVRGFLRAAVCSTVVDTLLLASNSELLDRWESERGQAGQSEGTA